MMNLQSFTDLLKAPKNIEIEHLDDLESLINEYPYFQGVRAIYLKELKKNGSFKYNKALKKTAAYTTDRAVLFDFIISQVFTQEKNIVIDSNQTVDVLSNVEKSVAAIEKTLDIGTPISFTHQEQYSFNQWLQLSSHKKIDRQESKENQKTAIIDNFIRKNPKISKISKDSDKKATRITEQEDAYLMTETLAKVYLEQKKYENAIKAYEILSLKYPEKSSFFADQIKRIRILQNK